MGVDDGMGESRLARNESRFLTRSEDRFVKEEVLWGWGRSKVVASDGVETEGCR